MKTIYQFALLQLLALFILLAHAQAIPQVQLSITGNAAPCAGRIQTYTYPGPSSYNYTWSITGQGASLTPTVGNQLTVTWGSAGPGSVSVLVKNGNVTVDNTTLNVTVSASPQPYITTPSTVGCTEIRGKNLEQGANGAVGSGKQDTCYVVCHGSPVQYQTPLHSGSTYSWSASGHVSLTPQGAGNP